MSPRTGPAAAPAPSAATSLNAARRRRELAELAARPEVDVLVVGGGATGAGAALDAASRGLSVVLAEQADLAYGTSRFSSKLVHGGLRYLAKGQVGVAYESARERAVLLRTAPHLVRALPMVMPLHEALPPLAAAVTRAGLRAGDALRAAAGTGPGLLPRSRRLTRAQTLRVLPAVRPDGLRGALLSFDGQLVDDARLVVALARTAAGYGARILTRCAVRGADGGGAVLRDTLGGAEIPVRAKAVVNATGVHAGALAPEVRLRPSRGTHIVLPGAALGGPRTALTVPVPGAANRYVFALPQDDGRVFAGLTDEPVAGPLPDVPDAPESDIAFLLDVLNSALATPLHRRDVIGAFAGLRPLLDTRGGASADLSRRHAVLESPSGVITVVGGKLTTYRRMAEDAVDAVAARPGIAAGPCRTRSLPLVGAAAPAALAAVDAPRRLVARYGTEAAHVAAASGDAADPVAAGATMGELRFAVRHEGALDAADLLDRRTRIGLVGADRAAAAEAAARALAAEAGPVGAPTGRGSRE